MPRIDLLLVSKGSYESRNLAQRAIKEGKVMVDGVIVTKPSQSVSLDQKIQSINSKSLYVSRSALKLKQAFDTFAISVDNSICCDIGASTGGFTQVLLERGARKVFAVDVGHNQLHPALLKDSRVVSYEKTNARELDRVLPGHSIDFACIDVSFISLTLILPSIQSILLPKANGVALIKPQFELSAREVGQGIVRDSALHEKAIARVITALKLHRMEPIQWVPAKVRGVKGNQEFLVHFRT